MLEFGQYLNLAFFVSYFDEPDWNFTCSVNQFDLNVLNQILYISTWESMKLLMVSGKKNEVLWSI